MPAETDIAAIDDGGANTASEVRTALTSVLGRADADIPGRPKQGSTVYFMKPGVEFSTVSTRALTANQIRYEPFLVRSPITIDAFIFEVSTAVASSNVRVAIYNADKDWQPTSLVIDAGNTSSATTGVKTVTITSTALPAGRYVAASWSGHAPTLRCFRGGAHLTGVNTTLGTTPFIALLSVTSTFGTYPSTGTAWTGVTASATPFDHSILFRITVP